MTSDVGMFKPVLPPLGQTGHAAPAGRVEKDATPKDDSAAVRKAEAAKKAAEAEEAIENVVSDLNQLVRSLHRELQFSIDEDSGETVVKVVDRETDEVLRQIPNKEVLELRKRLEETAGTIFHDSA